MDYTKEKFDIIIQGGQSNAEGTGYGDVSKEYTQNPSVLYLNAEKSVTVEDSGLKIEYFDVPFTITVADKRIHEGKICGDFSLSFAEKYVEEGYLEEGRKLLIIRGAVGGTGFQKKHWGLQDAVYLKLLEMVDYALSLNEENRVVGLLWHQGEHDAFEKNSPENYEKQLLALINDLYTRYGKVPFIAGEFVNEWKMKNEDICEPILKVIYEVVKRVGGGFVEASDLKSNNQTLGNGDDIHFSRESLRILGERYFARFQELKSK